MPSGKMAFTRLKDKKILLYKYTTKKNAYGEVIKTWKLLSPTPLWANYRSLSGNEQYTALTAGFTDEVQFTVNWRSDVIQGMNIVFRGKAYEVTRVDDLEGYKKDLILACKWLSGADLKEYPGIAL